MIDRRRSTSKAQDDTLLGKVLNTLLCLVQDRHWQRMKPVGGVLVNLRIEASSECAQTLRNRHRLGDTRYR